MPTPTKAELALYEEALRVSKATFDTLTKHLAELKYDMASTEEQIAKFRKTITALSAMCSKAPNFDQLGITDSVTQVMETAQSTMTTADVIAALEDMGFELATQKNAAASVHAVLSRMHLADKVTKVMDGNKVSWRGPKYDPDYDDIPF